MSEMQQILAKLSENNKKLDRLDTIVQKLDNIDIKVTTLDTRQLKTETKLETVEKRVEVLEKENADLKKNQARIIAGIRAAEIDRIRSQENSRAYNVILQNIPQSDMNEDPKTSLKLVRDILKRVMKVPNATNLVIRNAHRLPAVKGRPPIIFKLSSKTDKQLIWDSIPNLTAHNEIQESNDTKIYIDLTNLPPKLTKDKKELLEQYKSLRNDKKNPKWHYNKSKGEYCIKVGRRTIRPPSDNFLFPLVEKEPVVASTSNNVWGNTNDQRHSDSEDSDV